MRPDTLPRHLILNTYKNKRLFITIYSFSNDKHTSTFFKNKSNFFNSGIEIKEKNILIKGSRGMKMEEILKHIQ